MKHSQWRNINIESTMQIGRWMATEKEVKPAGDLETVPKSLWNKLVLKKSMKVKGRTDLIN